MCFSTTYMMLCSSSAGKLSQTRRGSNHVEEPANASPGQLWEQVFYRVYRQPVDQGLCSDSLRWPTGRIINTVTPAKRSTRAGEGGGGKVALRGGGKGERTGLQTRQETVEARRQGILEMGEARRQRSSSRRKRCKCRTSKGGRR